MKVGGLGKNHVGASQHDIYGCNLDRLHVEVQNIMEETTELKDQLKEVNTDMVSMLHTDRSKVVEKEKKEKLFQLKDHSLSEECPIDRYLVDRKHVEKIKAAIYEKKDSTKQNALKVLHEAQEAKERLEKNLFEVARKHKELDMFGFLEPSYGERDNNVRRIRKQVNEKIKKIENEIKVSLKDAPKENPKNKNVKKPVRVPLTQRYKKDMAADNTANETSKLHSIRKANKLKNLKQTQNKKAPPTSSTAYDDLIMQHIYGRQPHQVHRHTLKTETKQFCTPHNNQSESVGQAVTMVPSKNQVSVKHRLDDFYHEKHFHIHSGTALNNNTHMMGDLYPTAVPLAEPSYDPSGRLPLRFESENMEETGKIKTKKLTNTGPNVAVINMKSDQMDDSSSTIKDRIKLKVRERLEKKMHLAVQPLPNVDIDTTNSSSFSTTASIQGREKLKNTDESNDQSYGFQDFIEVKDYSKSKAPSEDEETLLEDSEQEIQFAIAGVTEPEPNYHGPVFPPEHSKKEEQHINDIPTITTLEQKAQEWLEQELLARIIGQLDNQSADPTLQEVADNVRVQDVNADEDDSSSYNWIDNLIGLQGIQLFVDAGVPVDQELVRDLIRRVILERLDILFGYPQPLREQQLSETAVDDEVHHVTVISTPSMTPAPSPIVSEKGTVKTPDQTITDLEEQSLDEATNSDVLQEQEVSYALVDTPSHSISESRQASSVPERHIETPHSSNENTVSNVDANTPNLTDIDEDGYVEQEDFIVTEPSISSVDDVKSTQKDLEPPVSLPTASPSTPSTAMTMTSSTAVGISTFDGISVGEHLHPSQVVSEENASEGELFVSMFGAKSVEELESELFPYDHDTQGTQIKLMMKELLQTKNSCRAPHKHPLESTFADSTIVQPSEGEVANPELKYEKSAGEVTQSISSRRRDVEEDFDEDTLEEVSIDERLFHQQRRNQRSVPSFEERPSCRLLAEKSEGEVISQGECFVERKDCAISTSVENDSEDLSIGQLNGECPRTDPQSPRTMIMSASGDSSSKSPDQQNDDVVPHLITVRSRPKEEDRELTENFLSEGEQSLFLPPLDDGTGENKNVEEREERVKMVLRLPGIEDENEPSTLSEVDILEII